MAKELKDLVEIPEICPVTGLKYKTNPDWNYHTDDYALNIGLLGDRIILPYEAGNVDLNTTKIYCDKVQMVIDSNNLMEKGFIVIEDYTFIRTIDNTGKDYFINFYQTKQPSIQGLYFIGVSRLIKFTIGIIRHLPIIKSDLLVFSTIEEAQIAAFKKLDIEITKINNFNVVNDGFSVNINVYNKKTIYTKISGFFNEKALPEINQKLETLLKLINAKKGHYRIVDYSDLKGGSDKARRKYLQSVLHLNKKYPMIAYIVIGAPKNIKTIISISKTLVSFDVFFVNTLEQAYEKIKQLDKKTNLNKRISSKKIKQYLNEILDAFNEINSVDFLETKIKISKENPYVDIFNSYEIIKRDFNFLLNENEKLSKQIDKISSELKETNQTNYQNLKIITAKLNEIINSISINTQSIFEQNDVPYPISKTLNKILYKTSILSSSLNDSLVLSFVPVTQNSTTIKNIINDIKEIFYNISFDYNINFINNNINELEIKTNESIIKQIIINILSSIINKKPKTNITVYCSITDNNLEFNIKVNEKLFTYEQINNINSTKQNKIVTDINLSIAKSLTKKIASELIITSEKETNFFFTTQIHKNF